MGGPPLFGIIVWGITILERAAYEEEPVRLAVVSLIADILKMIVLIVGVIVVALAAVNARFTTAAGSIEINGDEDS